MSLDLDDDDAACALGEAVGRFARERCDDGVVRAAADAFPLDLWRELAALGVLATGAPGGDGGVVEIAVAMEALGRAAFPGPLAETFLAVALVEPDEREAIVEGRCLVSAGAPPLLPFAPVADLFLEVADTAVYRAAPVGPIEPVEVLGGEPWGRVALQRGPRIAGDRRALAIGAVARAAYTAGLARRLVEEVAEHARTRKQFGRAIGDFQAVAHPLADDAMRLDAARALARRAAWQLDAGTPAEAEVAAASAALSCRAAGVSAAHTAHQVYGAVGITLEGPAFHLTRRLRQLASAAPGPDAARERMLARLGLVGAGPAPTARNRA